MVRIFCNIHCSVSPARQRPGTACCDAPRRPAKGSVTMYLEIIVDAHRTLPGYTIRRSPHRMLWRGGGVFDTTWADWRFCEWGLLLLYSIILEYNVRIHILSAARRSMKNAVWKRGNCWRLLGIAGDCYDSMLCFRL